MVKKWLTNNLIGDTNLKYGLMLKLHNEDKKGTYRRLFGTRCDYAAGYYYQDQPKRPRIVFTYESDVEPVQVTIKWDAQSRQSVL